MESLLKPSVPATLPSVTPNQFRGLRVRLRRQFALVLESLLIRCGWTIKLLNFLREHCPILVTPWFAIVTRYDDVCDILCNSEIFEVNYYKAGPDQIIAMRDDEKYRRDLAQLEHARDRELQYIRPAVRACAEPLITEA